MSMKKFSLIFGMLIIAGALFLGSCNSNKTLCPAYPPSTYSGNAENIINQNVDNGINFQYIEREDY